MMAIWRKHIHVYKVRVPIAVRWVIEITEIAHFQKNMVVFLIYVNSYVACQIYYNIRLSLFGSRL